MWQKLENLYEGLKSRLWLNLLFHGILIAALVFLWLPVARIFYDSFPPLGNDYYQFPNYLNSLSDSFRLPPMSWRYDWFIGQPLMYDHPWLHVYLASPFVKIFGLFQGANIYSLATLFLFFLFTYLATYQISKNKILAGILTTSLFWVSSLYDPLYYGGNANFSSTLFFLPLIIFLILKYYESDRRRYFYTACLFQGVSFLAHPGEALFFIFFPTVSVLFLYSSKKVKFLSWRKLKDLFIFLLTSAFIGAPLLYSLIKLYMELVSFGKEVGEGKELANTFSKMRIFINLWIFVPLAISFVSAIFSRKFFDKLRKFIPFIIIFAYIFCLEWLYYVGKNPLRGNILPERTFWLISLTAVLSIAVFWSKIIRGVKKAKDQLGLAAKIIIIISQISIIAFLGYLSYPRGGIENMLAPVVATEIKYRRFADVVPRELANPALIKGDTKELEKSLPSFMDLNSYDYRIHSLTPGFNIWWTNLYRPPLTHGYYDSRSRQEQDWAYWMDTALAGELTYRYDQPAEMSKNSALFLIDWFAIKYLEGIEVDYKTGRKINNAPDTVRYDTGTKIASYLVEDPEIVEHNEIIVEHKYLEEKAGGKVPVAINEFQAYTFFLKHYGVGSEEEAAQIKERKPMTDEEIRERLRKKGYADFWVNMDFESLQGFPLPPRFLAINDDNVSPLVNLTNSPSCLVIGTEKGYNNFIRALGQGNNNTKYLIPIRGGKSVNKVSKQELNNFDCVVLYLYESINLSSWKKLEKYVEEGGKLFIDTGGEVAESEKTDLPHIFPIERTNRRSLGKNWNITDKAEIFKDIKFNDFDALEYEGDPWNLSYAIQVKEGAEILLAQNDSPIMVEKEFGQGKVLWSGINLPFRVNYYHNSEELELFNSFLYEFLDYKRQETIETRLERPKSEELIASGLKAKGILFKENFDSGWKAKYSAGDKSGGLKIYPAGPDMMYARLPDDISGEVKVNFNFVGSKLAWFFFILILITILILILLIVFEHKLFKFTRKSIKSSSLTKKMSSWWEKDEEE